jgi:hypothetical protein
MKVAIKSASTGITNTFQGNEEEVFKNLLDFYGFLGYRCKTIDDAFRELSRCQDLFLNVEE